MNVLSITPDTYIMASIILYVTITLFGGIGFYLLLNEIERYLK